MDVSTGDLWGKLGEMEQEDCVHLLHFLFSQYEKELEVKPEVAEHFFMQLQNGLEQVSTCNVSRR